jgi:hypothetical protein
MEDGVLSYCHAELAAKGEPRFQRVSASIVAAKYMQLENQIQLILDISIAANLPNAKKSEESK